MGSMFSFFKSSNSSRSISRTSTGSNSGSVTGRTASYGSKKSSMTDSSSSNKAAVDTQKKQKYAYIPDNFTSIEQVSSLSLSLTSLNFLASHFLGSFSSSAILCENNYQNNREKSIINFVQEMGKIDHFCRDFLAMNLKKLFLILFSLNLYCWKFGIVACIYFSCFSCILVNLAVLFWIESFFILRLRSRPFITI